MIETNILAWALILVAFLTAVIHQQHLVTRIIKQNAEFLKGADLRLAAANEMALEDKKSVRRMADSADKLADTIVELKDVIVDLRERDEKIMEEIRSNRNTLQESYIKLLTEYQALDKDFKDELKLLANKSTVSNYNIPEKTTLT